MIDINIKRFCQLVTEINDINQELDKEREVFYDGGNSFEECNQDKIEEIVSLQNEMKNLSDNYFKGVILKLLYDKKDRIYT
jgi:hypothetical protein